MNYDLENLPLKKLIGPVVDATSALTRLDERIARSDIKDGWIERMHYLDACASLWIDGDLVHLEDLVLHDASRDIQTPSHVLTIAASVLRARRRIARRPPGWALDADRLRSLRNNTQDQSQSDLDLQENPQASPAVKTSDALIAQMAEIDAILARSEALLTGASMPSRDNNHQRNALVYEADWHEDALFADWQTLLRTSADLPAVLRAALLLDAWAQLHVLQHCSWLGRSLIADFLREQGGLSHLVALNVGLRQVPIEKRTSRNRTKRLFAILTGMTATAGEGIKLHDSLSLAHQQMLHNIGNRRQSSHLPALIELVLAKPMVSTEMVAVALSITPRSALRLIDQLSLREMTGRGRFRAWGVV